MLNLPPSEDLLWTQQQMLEASLCSTLLVDVRQPGWPVIYANAAFEQLTGYRADEITGQSTALLRSDRDPQTSAVIRQALEDQASCTVVTHGSRKDGSPLSVQMTLAPIRSSGGAVQYYMVMLTDISAQRTTEWRLRSVENRLEQLFENHQAVRLVIDPNTGRIQDANAAACKFYGYSREQLRSMHIQDINVLSQDEIFKEMQKAVREERTYFEFRHRLASGEIRNVDVFSSPVDTDEGRLLFSIVVDVGSKREAEVRYRSLFEQSNDAVFILSTEGQHLQANGRAAHMLGYEPHELMGMSSQDTIIPEEQSASENMRERLLAGEQIPPYERRFRHRDGHAIPVEINVELVRDSRGQPLHILSVVRDISERKQIENQLRESEQKFRGLIEQSIDGVAMTDENGLLIEWNQSLAQLTGIATEQVLGKPIWDVQFQIAHAPLRTPQAYEGLKAAIQMGLQTGNAPWLSAPREAIIERPDGTTRIVQASMFPIRTGSRYRIGSVLRDMTERHQMEAALRANEALYRGVIEASLDAFYLMESVRDAGGTITDFRIAQVNDNAVREMDMPREELVGALICEKFPINRTNGFFERYKRVVETGLPLDEDYEIPAGYAAPGWYHHQVVRVGDGIAIMNRDITTRKQTEAALRRSEESLRLTLEGTQAGTWDWNIVTGETVFNERWAAAIGYTLDALAPISIQTWIRLVHPDDLQVSNEKLARCFRRETPFYECEARMRHKDGHWVWVLDRGMVTEWSADGQPLHMYGTHLDITARKQMEEALRESESKYRLIAENTFDGIIIVEGATGQISYASPAYDHQHGREVGDSVGVNLLESAQQIIHPDDREAVLMHYLDAVMQKKPLFSKAYRALRNDGRYFWREDHTRFVYGPDGTYERSYTISRDITERKEAQEREIVFTLEKERTRMLTRFIRDSAHEFRTPMSIINSNAYLAGRMQDMDRRLVYTHQITEQVSRIEDLLDKLLLMSRLESSDASTAAPMAVDGVLRAAFMRVQARFGRSLHVTWTLAPDLPKVIAEPDTLLEALGQILDNAGRFNKAGGTITLNAQFREGRIAIDICDTGQGIAEEDMPRILETFWRRDDAHSTPGFGLGLPIAQRIIQRFGGDIMISSQVGVGTCVQITLPAAP